MAKLNPIVLRDFRQGRFTQSSVSTSIAPQNSVSDSLNVNFDTIVGSGVVRPGTTLLGSTVVSGKSPNGLGEFTQPDGTHILLVSFNGTSSATLYRFANPWTATNLTTLGNDAKVRFATLGGSIFIASGTGASNGMRSSTDGATFSAGPTNNCIATADVIPTLLYRYKARLLASGSTAYRSRVYFSSVVDPTVSPFITWNVNQSTGDWIDVNPDDGGSVTGFSESSTFLLVFKDNGMYRMDTVSKTVDPDNIFNVGAFSQEGITLCQGVTYFYSGIDIRRTNGGYPEQISRAGVQDYIDAIPLSNQSIVSAGTDGINVYFSIGDITLNSGQNNQVFIDNCVLKFSTRDETWSVHSYNSEFHFFAVHTNTSSSWGGPGTFLYGASTDGDVQAIDVGMTDSEQNVSGTVTPGQPIYFSLTTQDLEFGSRAHWKNISDKIIVYTNFGGSSTMQCVIDGGDTQDIDINLNNRVNIGTNINLGGHFFNFVWSGNSSKTPPIFEGFELVDIDDTGIHNE